MGVQLVGTQRGPHEVAGELDVVHDTGELDPALDQTVVQVLEAVHDLGRRRVCEPFLDGDGQLLVRGHEVHGGTALVHEHEGGHLRAGGCLGVVRQAADDDGHVLLPRVQPIAELLGGAHPGDVGDLGNRGAGVVGSVGTEGLEQTPAQLGTELELVEDHADPLGIGLGQYRVIQVHAEGQVRDQAVEFAVAPHEVLVLAQGLTLLAGDPVRMLEQRFHGTVGRDPLGREAGTHARYTR